MSDLPTPSWVVERGERLAQAGLEDWLSQGTSLFVGILVSHAKGELASFDKGMRAIELCGRLARKLNELGSACSFVKEYLLSDEKEILIFERRDFLRHGRTVHEISEIERALLELKERLDVI